MTWWPHPRLELHDPDDLLGEVPAAVAQALDGLPSVHVHLHRHTLLKQGGYGTVGRIEVFDSDLPEGLRNNSVPVGNDTLWFTKLDELGLLPPEPHWRALIGDKPTAKSERESPFLRGGSGTVTVDDKPLEGAKVESIEINPNWDQSAVDAFRPNS